MKTFNGKGPDDAHLNIHDWCDMKNYERAIEVSWNTPLKEFVKRQKISALMEAAEHFRLKGEHEVCLELRRLASEIK
jgi:hypothetical protein